MTELLVPELAQSDVSFRFYPFKRQNGSESFLSINLNINAYISETGGLKRPKPKSKIIPDVSVVDIHCCNRASGHICHVIEVNMH